MIGLNIKVKSEIICLIYYSNKHNEFDLMKVKEEKKLNGSVFTYVIF